MFARWRRTGALALRAQNCSRTSAARLRVKCTFELLITTIKHLTSHSIPSFTGIESYDITCKDSFSTNASANTATGFFRKVKLEHCIFEEVRFINCTFINVVFHNCHFKDVHLRDLYLHDVTVLDVDLHNFTWESDSVQDDVVTIATFAESLMGKVKRGEGLPLQVTSEAWLTAQQAWLDGGSAQSKLEEGFASQLQLNTKDSDANDKINGVDDQIKRDALLATQLQAENDRTRQASSHKASQGARLTTDDETWLAGGQPTPAKAHAFSIKVKKPNARVKGIAGRYVGDAVVRNVHYGLAGVDHETRQEREGIKHSGTPPHMRARAGAMLKSQTSSEAGEADHASHGSSSSSGASPKNLIAFRTEELCDDDSDSGSDGGVPLPSTLDQ